MILNPFLRFIFSGFLYARCSDKPLLLPRILSLRGSAAVAHGVTGSLRIVPSWYWCTSNSGLGQICGYSAHSVEGRVLRTTANRPGQYSFLSDFIHKFHTHLVDSTYPLSYFVN